MRNSDVLCRVSLTPTALTVLAVFPAYPPTRRLRRQIQIAGRFVQLMRFITRPSVVTSSTRRFLDHRSSSNQWIFVLRHRHHSSRRCPIICLPPRISRYPCTRA